MQVGTVHVLYTSIEATLAAMRVAADFARALGVSVTLVHFRTVPYAVPVDAPGNGSPIVTNPLIERLKAQGVDVRVRVFLCRDERGAIRQAFRPHSLVVVAGRHRLWPTAAARWRRMLEAAGHYVVFVDASDLEEKSDA